MHTAFIVVTAVLIVALCYAAWADFARYDWLLDNMRKARVPQPWLPVLGALKAAGALGLLAGFWLPSIGTAAAIGLVVYFVGALVTHLRAHYYNMAFASVFLLLAVTVLLFHFA